MSETPQTQPPGWYYAQGDPAGTQRFWDGSSWQGGPQPVPGANLPESHDQLAGAIADPVARVGARVVDGMIWLVVGYLVPVVLIQWIFGTEVSWFGRSTLVTLVFGLLVVTYEIFMIDRRGATLGKLVMSLTVVNDDGTIPDLLVGLRRMVLFIVFVLLSFFGLLGIVAFALMGLVGLGMLFIDAKRQTPWDKMARTLVVERK